MVCSKNIANFEFTRVMYIRFSIFYGIMLVLNVQLIFDSYFALTCFGSSSIFASSVSGTRKSHRGPDLGNTVKIRAQATMCKQGHYHGAKANFCSSTNPGVFGELLRANCA